MSLLLPETIYVGLFPGQCWLHSRRIKEEPSLALAQTADPQALLGALETMLDDKGAAVRKGSRVVISVSDSVSALVTLPWQEALRTPEELDAYAKACFENQGMVINDSWVMRTEFRRHRSNGIAYALPLAWLTQLLTTLKDRGLRLHRALPIAAAAYCAEPGTSKAGQRLVLLQERHRISALTYGTEGLLGFDVEPIVTGSEIAGTRLLRRMSAKGGDIAHVSIWSPELPELPEQAPSADFITTCLTDIKVQRLVRGAWE